MPPLITESITWEYAWTVPKTEAESCLENIKIQRVSSLKIWRYNTPPHDELRAVFEKFLPAIGCGISVFVGHERGVSGPLESIEWHSVGIGLGHSQRDRA